MEQNSRVAVLGHTTRSHLGLPDEEKSKLMVIWLADVRDSALSLWQIFDDTPERRREFGLEAGGKSDAP